MFDAIAKTIDPITGRPYSFGLDGSNDKTQRPWTPIDPSNGLAQGDYQGGMSLAGAGLSPQFLQQIGYTGPDPLGQTDGNGGFTGTDPAFLKYLQDNNIQLGHNAADGKIQLGAFRDGQQVGFDEWADEPDAGFGAAILAATGFAGAAAGGAFAGSGAFGTGAAPGAVGSGISADSLAYGALENGAAYGSGFGDSLVASNAGGFGGALGEGAAAAGGGMSSADLAALYGAEGYGTGASAGELAAYGGGAGGSGLMSQLGGYASDASSWMKANPGLTNIGGQVVNGLIGSYTAGKALDAQKDATNQSNALWAPYRELGNTGVAGINNLLKNPGSVVNDPGYAFGQQQGQQALDRRSAAAGGYYSGAAMKGASRFNTDYATSKLDNALARYSNAAQIGATGTSNTSNNITNLGNAGAASSLYQGNVLQNGVNGALANFNGASTYYDQRDPRYRGYGG